MDLFEPLNHAAGSYLSSGQLDDLKKAFTLAKVAHDGQFRSSGEPYIMHPVAVATILANLHVDHETLMAALLHDVIEDTFVAYEDLDNLFGHTVAELVDGVSKLDKLKFRNRIEAEAENFRKMIIAMAQDVRVIFIKLADRTHNMRTLDSLRLDKRRRIAKETLEIYAPLAHRLGINTLKLELEERSFAVLYPHRSLIIRRAIESARRNRKEMISSITEGIKTKLSAINIEHQVYAQEKSVYAIYQKMRLKEQRFHSIMDLFSFRIIVNDIDTCYRVLGQMHSLYKPRIGYFKDYISIPKVNDYQSLHTSLIGPHGVPVETMIRTAEMNEIAEKGITANWIKEGSSHQETNVKIQVWMKNLLELQNSVMNSFDFIENVKSDLLPRYIYVFTPKGRIVELPAGSTPIDLAYAVHTDIGNHCIGAKVNKQPFPLSKALSNGQTIDIMVSPSAIPSTEWLNYAVSSKARSRIRQTLKKLKREDAFLLGQQLLTQALKNYGYSIGDIPSMKILSTLATLKVDSLDELLVEIGMGNLVSESVTKRLCQHGRISSCIADKLIIKGTDNILLSQADCCYPIPGDTILCHVSLYKGVFIHHTHCRNVNYEQQHGEQDRIIPAQWAESLPQEFIARLDVILNSDHAYIQLLNTIHLNNISLHSVQRDEKQSDILTVTLLTYVKDVHHLVAVMDSLSALPDITSIARNTNNISPLTSAPFTH